VKNASYKKTYRQFPAIVVECPHREKGSVWIAKTGEDLIEQLENGNYGEGWGYELFESREQIAEIYGDDPTNWPETLRGELFFPCVRVYTGGWSELVRPEDFDLVEFALGYVCHDLRGVFLCEAPQEARELYKTGWRPHNVSVNALHDCMQELGWSL